MTIAIDPKNFLSNLRTWIRSGAPWIWLTSSFVTLSLVVLVSLLLLMALRGLSHFWPGAVLSTIYQEADGTHNSILGEIIDSEMVHAAQVRDSGYQVAEDKIYLLRNLIKVGNRDVLGQDFRWLLAERMGSISYPEDILVVERREWGNCYGTLRAIKEHEKIVAQGADAWIELQKRIERSSTLFSKIKSIEKDEVGAINYRLEQLRLKERRLNLKNQFTVESQAEISKEQSDAQAQYVDLQKRLAALYKEIERDSVIIRMANDKEHEVAIAKIVRAYFPNQMTIFDKMIFYAIKFGEFVTDEPRESNTEGGIFPAIFGTVLMVIIMSILVMPLGVVAAVYLREYARQGPLTRLIRIAVNNLAGVPSVVYGVFGLGFFVYFLGSNIDQYFFPEALPNPTFGTPGILWSSVVLALLTLPVVIVAAEEGLMRIPRTIREGSLALGATQAETLWRVVLPMAAPGIMTGLILSVARAAGEVAPLMMVGVVKLAPSLPLDGNFPFLHLDRKFMHMGFHIYDVGFQSPNVEAARPLVYATALLLIMVVVFLNLGAIYLRDRLRERYRGSE